MRLLFFKSNIFMQEDWFETLRQYGYEVHPVTYIFTDYDKDDFFAGKFRRRLNEISYDAVVSFNFYPVISDICEEYQVLYISWIYDSPIPHFWRFDTRYNRVFHFDKKETDEYRRKGYQFIRHLPLAVNTKRLDLNLGELTSGILPDYTYEISFVGNLYSDRTIKARNFVDSAYIQGVLEGYAAAQTQFFGEDIADALLKESEYLSTNAFSDDFPWEAFVRSVHEDATYQERRQFLQKLSQYFSVDFFTSQQMCVTAMLQVHPPVGYYTEMPVIFRRSKINLNINYRSIRSGMSARILDIMGSGGFLMTTPQPELFDYFKEDEDFVSFCSVEELVDKCAYYLSHDEERHQIALQGYQKIKEMHDYKNRFSELFAEL